MIAIIIKWPYLKKRLIRLLLKDINDHKPKELAKTEFVFVDPEGKRYYQYPNLFDMPVCRKQKLEILAKEHQEKLSFYDVKVFIDAGKAILEEGKGVVQKIGYWLGVMEDKAERLFHPYTFMEMAACMLIHEDQDPSIWDEELEAQKIENFKKWCKSKGGLHAFFMEAGLSSYFPFLKSMEKDFNEYFRSVESSQKNWEVAMKGYTQKS